MDSMRDDASGRISPALGERCFISETKRGRGGERRRFCLEREEGKEDRAAAKRAPSGCASGGADAPALLGERARAPVSAVNSPAAMCLRLAARISPRIEPLTPSSLSKKSSSSAALHEETPFEILT